MKKYYLLLCIFFTTSLLAQVGINTTTPNAQLDIQSSNQVTPANTDGLLIPKVDTFPTTNPTAAQQGMLVYLTSTVGSNPPGFYYWDNPTTTWINIKGSDGGTLDQAYDFGGAGNGRTITADAGAVTIAGRDGLVSTGIQGTGAVAPSGASVKMLWNPRKASFRAGETTGTEWDDINIGIRSTAFGFNAIASGNFSTAFGGNTTASGTTSTAFGSTTIASGFRSTVFGYENTSSSHAETVLGIGATTYTPSTNGATQFRIANATDRLFVIGNAIDANSNTIVDASERSDAMIVLKNGLTRLPSTTNTMIDAADGKTVVTKEYLQNNTSGTLDQAYDFGGPGVGRTITADAGAVTIDGTDGLVSTGTSGSGSIAPSGAGTKLVWNPRRRAFRVGNVNGSQWDDINIGNGSIGFGENTTANGIFSTAFGFGTTASGSVSTAFGQNNVASGLNSFAFGFASTASGSGSTVFGNFNLASGGNSLAFGINTTASGSFSTALGRINTANGDNSFVLGINNTARSFGETVIGLGATAYTPSTNGATQFSLANTSDRLFVIGNAIDANNSGFVDAAERSDAMIVLKNGLTRLPSTTNTMIDAADGKAVVTKEWVENNTTNTAWNLTGNSGTNPATNFIGTFGSPLVFRSEGLISGRLGSGNTSFGQNSLTNHLTSNIFNAAFGNFALSLNTNGQGNTALGNASLRQNLTGSFNVAIGINSLFNNISGNNNVAIGNNSLIFENNVNNTAIGSGTMTGNNIGSGNSALGFNALDALNVGSNNTAIGSSSDVGNVNNATAIGSFAFVNSSNSMVLGSINGINGATATVNVGIGTTTPLERLHVAGRAFLTDGFSTDNAALLYRNNTDYMFLGPQSGSSANGAAMALFGTTNTSGGNAGGVDFNVPNGQVRMNHTGGNYVFRANSTSGYTSTFELNDVGLQIGHNSASRALIFSPNNTERMRLTPTGEVGIATTTPSQRLDLGIGNIAVTQGDIYLGANNGVLNAGGGLMISTINYIGDSFVAPTQVNGDEDLYIADDIELGGQGYKPGGGAWVAPSDRRLKHQIQLYTDGLESLLQINPVSYKYNSIFETLDTGETYIGVIAQEVQEIAPYMINEKPFGQIVEEDENGHEKIIKQGTPYLTFDSSALTYMLINAVKEINSKYEELKAENEALENKLSALLSRIENLEKK